MKWCCWRGVEGERFIIVGVEIEEEVEIERGVEDLKVKGILKF